MMADALPTVYRRTATPILRRAVKGPVDLYAQARLALFRLVDPPLEVDDLGLDFFHRVPHQELVAGGQGDDGVRRFFYLFDEVTIDHHRMAIEPSQSNHILHPYGRGKGGGACRRPEGLAGKALALADEPSSSVRPGVRLRFAG